MLAVVCSLASATPPFAKNSQHVSFNLGFSDSLNKDYVGFGLGYRYFLLDGFNVGLDFDLLLGDNPIIYRVSPEIRYVFYPLKTFIPYVGAFYQYNYIVDMENKGGFGARAGLYTPLWSQTYVGYGLSLGELRQCETEQYGKCSTAQIELNLSLQF
ncbi:MAG: hypothetical protein AMJ53_16970 [Gammaproteobacteria bacterium SG8_11]|nr:MAG: hypothetical protein AMJ53_16970 [Gammaproteobacteria bacterium SG8_11]